MPSISTKALLINELAEIVPEELALIGSETSDSLAGDEDLGPCNLFDLEMQSDPDDSPLDIAQFCAEEQADLELRVATKDIPVHGDSYDNDMLSNGDLVLGFCLVVLINILSCRYFFDRSRELRDGAFADTLLNNWKFKKPERFRRWLRIEPDTFDQLVADLSAYAGFKNRSYMKQKPVALQVAIVLYRFGSFGNRGGVEYTADLFGVSYGMVHVATSRVILACGSIESVKHSVRWPTREEVEVAKASVEEMAGGNAEMAKGWAILDGTLIRLYQRPHYCGSIFYDRKSRYSLNVQLTTLPSGAIIDYTCGHAGSTHDSLCLRSTRLFDDQRPEGKKELLGPNEFCWADSAYPLSNWLVKPYTEKEVTNSPAKKRFNKFLSRIRVRSEHSIGFLKGRFQSLQGLRIIISAEKDMPFVRQWIKACIHIHMFAFKHERIPCVSADKFVRRGYRWERRQARMLRRQEAQRLRDIEAELSTRQNSGYTRRLQRVHLDLGRIRRDQLCDSIDQKRRQKRRH